MPGIVTGESTHLEGENIRTMARVVDLDQTMLTPDDAGALTINIYSRGGLVYTKSIDAGTATGMLSSPTKPSAWTKRGYVNFIYTHDAATLAAESPPFAFQGGGRGYLIEYVFASVNDGDVILHHQVRVL